MHRLQSAVAQAQNRYALLLQAFLTTKVFDRATYQRYLSMHYHLSKGIQRDFMLAAAHSDLNKRRTLRAFLVDFANERELHYLVAANDLHMLGLDLLPEPLDATLWHAYFDKMLADRPFIRLGAACTVENISSGAAGPWTKTALAASFLNRDNTKYLALHAEDETAYGAHALAVMEASNLREHHIGDLVLGAKQGAVFYLRLMEWVLNQSSFSTWPDNEWELPVSTDVRAIEAAGVWEITRDHLTSRID